MRSNAVAAFVLTIALAFLATQLLLIACGGSEVPTLSKLQGSPNITPAPITSSPVEPNSKPVREPIASVDDGLQEVLTPAHPPGSAPTPTVLHSGALIPSSRLRQLTSGGCCTNPFWSADSRFVQFIDRPASRPPGIYGVDVERFGPPTLISEWIVRTSGGGAYYVYPDGGTTIVQRVATGEKYVINNGGHPVTVSPDGRRLLWQVVDRRGDFDMRRSRVWIANVDGSDARLVGETVGINSVGINSSGWIDSQRVLLVGVPLKEQPFAGIVAVTLGATPADDRLLELARAMRPRQALVSPGGNWLVYLLAFQKDSSHDGLWVVPTDGSQPPRKLKFFGGFQWRDDTHLLYIPMEPGVESHALWEYDVLNDAMRRLTDPTQARFKIAQNDWSVSNDGRYVAFVNAADHNLWLIDFSPVSNN